MSIGWNAAQDALVTALAVIAADEVNDACAPTVAYGAADRYVAVREVRKAPVPLGLVPQAKLPILSIFVSHEESYRHSMHYQRDSLVTVTFEWFCIGTPLSDLDERWQLARLVWRELVGAVQTGEHAGVNVLEPAGIVRHVENSEVCDYSLLDGDSLAYPHFVGKMTMQQRLEAFDVDALPYFDTLGVWLNRWHEGTETTHHALGLDVTTDAWGWGFSSGFGVAHASGPAMSPGFSSGFEVTSG